MIEFQNIECDLKINKKEFSFWLNEIIIEEKKILGEILYIFCDDDYLLTKNIKPIDSTEVQLNKELKLKR